MFTEIYKILDNLLGLNIKMLLLSHLVMRGLVVFFLALLVIKINPRFIGMRTQFNFILLIMLGSILATAITGNAPFFPVLGMVGLLLLINWLLIKLSFYFPQFEEFFKGKSLILIKNGECQWHIMQRCGISHNDLLMQLRLKLGLNDLHYIQEAFIENNGDISFILKK